MSKSRILKSIMFILFISLILIVNTISVSYAKYKFEYTMDAAEIKFMYKNQKSVKNENEEIYKGVI